MRSVSGVNTKPEIAVRKYLFARGLRYSINVKKLPGKPDIYLAKYHAAVFTHGCFWHGHQSCKNAALPKSNNEYWIKKIGVNAVRDATNEMALTKLGIKVFTIWECEINTAQRLKETLDQLYLRIKSLKI